MEVGEMEVGEMEVGEVVQNLSTIIVQPKNSTSLQVQSVQLTYGVSIPTIWMW